MDTRENIIRSAQELIQTRGFNAFSFRDIAEKVGIKNASIHHYFPTKEDLGKEVIATYRKDLIEALENLSASKGSAQAKLDGLVALLDESVKSGKKICLCAMLMSDSATLDKQMQSELVELIAAVEKWLSGVLEQGKKDKVFAFSGQAGILARTLFASFQGIMMCARTNSEPECFTKAAGSLIALLRTS